MPDYVELYNGRKIYNYDEYEYAINRLKREGFECVDVGGSSPDFKDSVDIQHNDGVWFEYIRCRGPDCTVYNYICLKPRQRAIVRNVGYEYRGDDLGCHDEWDEVIEYRNEGGKIITNRIEGGHHIECPGAAHRIERIPATKKRDVRDLYYL